MKMTTLQASRLKGLLDKAKDTGLCEETATVAGLTVTVRNLIPEEYTEIYRDLEDVEEGVDYMHAHQIEHVSRAICEIEGQDFRGVKFIEVEETDPKTGEPVVVKVPRHEWIRDNIVTTWGREALHVVNRKFLDAAAEAEKRAREGVEFKVADETDEEKFRRLLMEALTAADEVTDEVRDAILKEVGLLVATSDDELKAANEKAKEFLAEQRAKLENKTAAAEPAPEAPQPVAVPQQLRDAVEPPEEAPQLTPEELMARRTPMNREPINAPVPPTNEVQTVVANKRPPLPQEHQIATSISPKAAARAQQYAALEADAASGGVALGLDAPRVSRLQPDLEHVIERPLSKDDSKPLIGGNPKGGVNPHFVDGTQSLGGGIDPRRRRR